jgi:hypothetical protein
MKGRRLTSVLCALSVAGALPGLASAQSLGGRPPSEYLSFSGVWAGSMSVLQRGKCSMNRSGRSDAQVKFRLSVEEDGALAARPESSLRVTNAGSLDVGGSRAASGGPAKKAWMGRLSQDLAVTLQAPGAAVCRGQPREFPILYIGSITEKAGRRKLAISADVDLCPDRGCSFKINFDLKQSGEPARGK